MSIALGGRELHPLNELGQHGQIAFCQVLDRLLALERFDELPHRENILDLAEIERDDRTPTCGSPDEPFLLELPESLSDRPSREVQKPGKLGLAETFAGGECSAKNGARSSLTASWYRGRRGTF